MRLQLSRPWLAWGSMVQLEVGQAAKDFFANLGRVEEDLRGMVRAPKFAPDRSLGPGGVAYKGKMQLETVAGVTAFRGQMQFTVLDSNTFAGLPASKEAQLLELAEEAGLAVPAGRVSTSRCFRDNHYGNAPRLGGWCGRPRERKVGRPGSVPYPAIGRGYALIGLT
jgi:hypothetical protein